MACRFRKKINTERKKDSIYDAWNDYPLPQLMFYNNPVRFKKGFESYDDFFKQCLKKILIVSNLDNII